MKKLIFTVAISLFMTFVLIAAEDNFDRDKSPLGDGDNWEVLSGAAAIHAGTVVKKNKESLLAVWKPSLDCADVTKLKVGVDILIGDPASTLFAGLAFDVRDAGNYATIRINGAGDIQFFRVVNTTEGIGTKMISKAIAFNARDWVRMEIDSPEEHRFRVRFTHGEDKQELWSGEFDGNDSSLLGGQIGIVSSTQSIHPKFDNFRIESEK